MAFLVDGKPIRTVLQRSLRGWLKHFKNILTPRIVTWIRQYNLKFLAADLVSALVITSICIPQALAYAVIAGQQPVYGLYANLVGPIFYTMFGTGVHTIVGALALMAIMVANVAQGVDPTAAPGGERFNQLTVTVCLVMGSMRIAMGILRFGFIADFISIPVLSSFVTGAGIVIAESQLKALLGFSCLDSASGCTSTRVHFELMPHVAGTNVFVDVYHVLSNLGHAHWPTIVVSACCIIILLLSQNKRIPKWVPSILLLMIFTTIISFGANFEKLGIKVVGIVPSGLPKPSMPNLNWADVIAMLPGCAVVAFVGYVGDIALGRQMGAVHGYKIDNNLEWIASGLSNVTAVFFGGGVPVSASYSRTAVNSQCGGKTQMVNVYIAVLVCLTLLFLTPTFRPLPDAVLASVVIVACKSLLSFGDLPHLWRTSLAELAIWLITFGSTITLGVQVGILIGMAVSAFWFIVEMALTGPVILTAFTSPRISETRASAAASTTTTSSTMPLDIVPDARVVVVGFTGPLYFGNSGRLYDYLASCAERRPRDDDEREYASSQMSRRRIDRISEKSSLLASDDGRREIGVSMNNADADDDDDDDDGMKPLGLLLDFDRVSSLDVTASKLLLEALTAFYSIRANANVANSSSRPLVAVSGLSRRLKSLFERNGLMAAIGEDRFFTNTEAAMKFLTLNATT